MNKKKMRFVGPNDWMQVQISPGKYFNENALTGFEMIERKGANPLHPQLQSDFESGLLKTFNQVNNDFGSTLQLSRYSVRMPFQRLGDELFPSHYHFSPTPKRLRTTSLSVILTSQANVRKADLGFHFIGRKLPSLRNRMKGSPFHGLIGNLGYFMTEGLIQEKHPWSHKVRFPEFPLPTTLSHLGFYQFKDADNNQVHSTFQGAHPAALGVTNSGQVEIIPNLSITGYKVTLSGVEFIVDAINDPQTIGDVLVFTPGYPSAPLDSTVNDWQAISPEIPNTGRVNLFVANIGDGQRPIEQVIQLWEGRAPIPSYGAVLSFSRNIFQQVFGSVESIGFRSFQIRIEPCAGMDIARFDQIIGGLVPIVADGRNLLHEETEEQVKDALQKFGNATSPIGECGRESRNFDLYLREPAGVLVETQDDQIGWVLFDGRHEMSIGANVVDIANILVKLQENRVFNLKHAVFIDGGSAMKVYAVRSENSEVELKLLNRVAAGSRNGPGTDPDGLNLYSTLMLELR